MKPGAAYDLLLDAGYIKPGPIGSPVDAMARATATAMAIGLRRGARLETYMHGMTRIDEDLQRVSDGKS